MPDHQLSLAIGREGQNARLAARLTGVRIDIRSETQLAEGVPARRDELDESVEYAEGQWIQNAETRRDGVARRRRHRDDRRAEWTGRPSSWRRTASPQRPPSPLADASRRCNASQ